MATFTYVARTRVGERVEGTLEATDRRAAVSQLERLGNVSLLPPVDDINKVLARTRVL